MPVGDGPNDSGASRYHLVRAVEDSLTRLNTDHLDLLYIHQWDGQTPIRETIATVNNLIRDGKVRYWGVSNFNGWQLAKTVYESSLAGLEGPIAQQVYYTPEAREIEYGTARADRPRSPVMMCCRSIGSRPSKQPTETRRRQADVLLNAHLRRQDGCLGQAKTESREGA